MLYMVVLKCVYCTIDLTPIHHLLFISSSNVLTYCDIYQFVRMYPSMPQQRRGQTAAAVHKSQVNV